MPRYFLWRLRILVQALLLLAPVWLVYYGVRVVTSNPLPTLEEVKFLILSRPLHTMDQSLRLGEFEHIIQTIKRVESSLRRDILQGLEMRQWFYRLMLLERARFMEEFLPQPSTRLIKSFLSLPREEQINLIVRAMQNLMASQDHDPELSRKLKSISKDQFEQYKAEVIQGWSSETQERLYGLLLTVFFDQMNSRTNPGLLNDFEISRLFIFQEVISEFKELLRGVPTHAGS